MRTFRMVAIAATATLALALAACSSNEGTRTAESSPAASDTTDGDIDGSTNTDLEAAIDAVGPAGLTEIIADQIKAKGSVDEATKTITFAFDMSEDFSKVLIACQVAQGLYNEPDWEAYDVNIAFTDSTVNCQEFLGETDGEDGSDFFDDDVDDEVEYDEPEESVTHDDSAEPASSAPLPADLPDSVHVPDAPLLTSESYTAGEHWALIFDDSPVAVGTNLVETYRGDPAWTELTATEAGDGGLWVFSDGTYQAGLVLTDLPGDDVIAIAMRVTLE